MPLDWRTTAAIFPGQGSQVVGMGADFAERYAVARDAFAQADEILGYSLSRICWSGPAETLDQTNYTQPALYVCSVAIWRTLQEALAGRETGLDGRAQPGRTERIDRRRRAQL